MKQIILAEQNRLEKKTMHRVFIDLESAYDRVIVSILIKKLISKGVSSRLCLLVESLLSNGYVQVAVNGELTSPIPRTRGLFQGSLLSPILFDVFIDDLAVELNNSTQTHKPMCFLFADDILLQSSSALIIQQMLEKTIHWCNTNGMKINVSKCGTFNESHGFKADNTTIPIVKTYKYLGVPIDAKGIRADLLLENNLRKATAAIIKLKQSLTSSSWPLVAKLNIYKMFVRSVLE